MINLILAWLNTFDMPFDLTFSSIYFDTHSLTHSRSCSTPFLKAFTDTVLCTLYFFIHTLSRAHTNTHTPKNNLLVAWTWRFLLSQYECIYNKSKIFFSIFLSMTTERWVVRHATIWVNENECMFVCVWHNDFARPHPNEWMNTQKHISLHWGLRVYIYLWLLHTLKPLTAPAKDIETHKFWNQSGTCTKDQY